MSEPVAENSAVASVESEQQSNPLDMVLDIYWTYIRPFWWMYVAGVVLFLLGALIFLWSATPMYRSICRMHISENETRVVKVDGIDDPGIGGKSATFLNTQMLLMTSIDIVRQAYGAIGATAEQRATCSWPKVEAVTGTNLVDISITSSDQELAAKVANAVANAYISSIRTRRTQISTSGGELLRDQLNDVGKNYDKAVQALLDYKHKNGITSLEVNYQQLQEQAAAMQERIDTADARAAEIDLSLSEIRANRQLATTMLPYLLAGDGGENDGESSSSAIPNNLFALQSMLLQHQMTLPELTARYGTANQSVQVHRQVTEMIKKASDKEVEICIKGLEMRRQRILKNKKVLEKQRMDINGRLAALDKLSGEYKRLEAAVSTLSKSMEMLTNRMNEIHINDAVNKLDDYAIFIVTAAVPARVAYYPVPKKVLALALICGIAVAALVAFLIVSMNNEITDVRAFASLLGPQMPVFGTIPHFSADELKSAMEKNETIVDEVFRNIRTSLNLTIATRTNKILVLTSGLQDAGKTLISCYLARSFAKEKKRVLLIDMDLRKAGVTKVLKELMPERVKKQGVSNVLVGDCKMSDVIVHLDTFGFDVAPVGPIPPNPSELLSLPALDEMLEEVKASYDQILIDTSPLLQVSDAFMILGRKLPFAMIVNLGRMTKPLAEGVVDRLRQLRLTPAGFLGNNAELPKNTYGKYGYGKYGYGYGRYGYGKYGKYGYGKYGYGYGKYGYGYGYGYGKYGYGYGASANDSETDKKDSGNSDAGKKKAKAGS